MKTYPPRPSFSLDFELYDRDRLSGTISAQPTTLISFSKWRVLQRLCNKLKHGHNLRDQHSLLASAFYRYRESWNTFFDVLTSTYGDPQKICLDIDGVTQT